MNQQVVRSGSLRYDAGVPWIYRESQRGHWELIAYEFSQRFQLGIVPETVMLQYSNYNDLYAIGSKQRFVFGTTAHKTSDLMTVCHQNETVQELARLACMDYFLEIGDRHEENWLVDTEGHIKAIDNEIFTSRNCTIFQSLRPTARTLLFYDWKHTPIMIEEMRRLVEIIGKEHGYEHRARAAFIELEEWEENLQYFIDSRAESTTCPMD